MPGCTVAGSGALSTAVPVGSGYRLRPYLATASDHAGIQTTYGAAFVTAPWPDDWDRFDEFDPRGVRVVEYEDGIVGFAISFRRRGFGYVSVVAVDPEHQRNGLASALVGECGAWFDMQGIDELRIDAFEDSPAAVACYLALGFEIVERIADPESTNDGG